MIHCADMVPSNLIQDSHFCYYYNWVAMKIVSCLLSVCYRKTVFPYVATFRATNGNDNSGLHTNMIYSGLTEYILVENYDY